MSEKPVSYGTMHVPDDPRDAEIERLQAEVERLTGQRDRLLDAGRRSLNWLSSYPGSGALGCYDEMRAAVDPLERVLTKNTHPEEG